jgi:dinuclear metal center YbgI/SA1388 family protein
MTTPADHPLNEIVLALETELRTSAIIDYPGAVNGLQLDSTPGRVRRVVVAVDACLPVIRAAVEKKADLLIVHHGLFWSGLQPLTGALGEKIRLAVENGLAIYANHLPLDFHPTLGNNARLGAALGLGPATPFLERKGQAMGLRYHADLERDDLLARVRQTVRGQPVHHCPGGPARIRQIGLITGGAGSEVAEVAKSGIDTFITGEGPHWSYTMAEELGINLIYAGHYATETFGVCALGSWLQDRYGLPWELIDHPTGL